MLNDELTRLLLERPIPFEAIVRTMAAAAVQAEPEDLPAVLEIARLDDVFDQTIAYPAIGLIPAWGIMGLQELRNMIINGPHRTAALSVLVAIAFGRVPTVKDLPFLRSYWEEADKYEVSTEFSVIAQRELRACILDRLSDDYSKSTLLWDISTIFMFSDESVLQKEKLNFLMDVLIDTHLILNEGILNEFETFLNAGPEREEELHQFILAHPILLDPFMIELRNKHELGSEFITDFVIRRINDEYVLVEIENSTDKLFRQDGSFTSDLMKAVAQVRDFQGWVIDNIAYAQAKLPGIRHPDGLVVIGLRKDLSIEMRKRLDEENFSRRGHIKILTYDDLLDQAKVVYKNILEKPIILRTKDQSTI